METLDSFGAWLRQRRTALRLTRAELADCAGCSVSALRKIEADERRPSRQLATLLAGCLRIAPEEESVFVDAARGVRQVARLDAPSPHSQTQPAASLPLLSSAAAKAGGEPPVWNLPALATPLIGREAELAKLAQLLDDPACRLLTLVGPGGIGKTRLAIEAAYNERERFADGVFFVSLASVSFAELMVPSIAQAINLNFSGRVEPRSQLVNYLSSKQALLLLDNLEHLLDGVGLLAELLGAASELKLLVTSRERIELRGEWVFEVQGLPVPFAGQVAGLESYSAVQLFLQRARQAQMDFGPGAAEWADIVRICRLVEGMPLALELAAAWVRLLSCAEIAAEIEQGLDFLARASRNVPPRQRSLRATFDYSWNLLAHPERRLLCRLAVFRGSFDRKAAEQIADASLPLLSALVDKSLLRRTADGRYDLHEVVRQYALLHLASEGEQEIETRDRHSRFYLALLSGRELSLRSGAQQQTMRELVQEIDNLRGAWSWAIERHMVGALARAVRSLGCLYELAGWLEEGVALLEQAVQCSRAHAGERACRQIVGEALGQQGLLLFRRGEFEQAKTRLRASLEWLRPFEDPDLLAPPLLFLGVMTQLDGNLAEGQALLEEALLCARAAQLRWYEAYAVYSFGYIASQRGQYEKGYQLMCDGLAIWRAIGDPRSIALGLNFIGSTVIQLGYHTEAEAFFQESLALCEQVGDRWGAGTAHRCLGVLALAQGDIDTARTQLHKSLDIFTDVTTGWDIARSLIYLGEADLIAGDPAEAELTLKDALAQARAALAAPLSLEALTALAALHLERNVPVAVLRLAAFVAGHPAATYETRTRAGHLFDTAAAQTGPQQVSNAREWAAAQSLESVVHHWRPPY